MNSILCQCCQNIFTGTVNPRDLEAWLVLKEHEPHHESIRELWACAEEKCALCLMLWHSFPPDDRARWVKEDENWIEDRAMLIQEDADYVDPVNEYVDAYGTRYPRTQLLYSLQTHEVWVGMAMRQELRLFVERVGELLPTMGKASQLKNALSFGGFPPDNLLVKPWEVDQMYTENAVQHLQNFIERCNRDHIVCRNQRVDNWLPTRLVKIGQDGEPPSLVECATFERPVQYTTLSHCWGTIPTIKLKRDNIDMLKSAIPDIPLTYKDAMRVTQDLGLEYIWIDSLCIVQDSSEDWNRECKEMANVYKNGHCNIVAMTAHDSHGGCFSQAGPYLGQLLSFDSAWSDEADGAFEISFQASLSSKEQAISGAPAHRRSWILQERLLSPRNIHFSQHMIYYECRCAIWCEGENSQEKDQTATLFTDDGKEVQQPQASLQSWALLVAAYTRTNLTLVTDKLVAISALAMQTQIKMAEGTTENCDYLAGLWRPQLLGQLLWCPDDLHSSRRIHIGAPTWSWASISGPITYGPVNERYLDEDLARVKRCYVRGPDPFTQVRSGVLQIESWLWNLKRRGDRVIDDPEKSIFAKLQNKESLLPHIFDEALGRWIHNPLYEPRAKGGPREPPAELVQHFTGPPRPFVNDEKHDYYSAKIRVYLRHDYPGETSNYLAPLRVRMSHMEMRYGYCLPFFLEGASDEPEHINMCLIEGLILKATKYDGSGFERVGLFYVEASSHCECVRDLSPADPTLWVSEIASCLRDEDILEAAYLSDPSLDMFLEKGTIEIN